MPEKLTQSERSRIMASVKSRDTAPEMIVRHMVHKLGYRFRLHRRDLPGTPDLVFPKLRKIVNVHGCFWHMHICQRRRRSPVNNADYWRRKRVGNAARDRQTAAALQKAGWQLLVVWECETRSPKILLKRLMRFLEA
jgi:DNA mismatch endonuclease, patch repair protein